jgi:hypothetical protein
MKVTDISKFVILWDNGSLSTADDRQISHMYDLSDCDSMEGVKAVYAVSDECELVPVTLGETRRENSDGDSIVWGYSPVLAGKRVVSHVHWSSH